MSDLVYPTLTSSSEKEAVGLFFVSQGACRAPLIFWISSTRKRLGGPIPPARSGEVVSTLMGGVNSPVSVDTVPPDGRPHEKNNVLVASNVLLCTPIGWKQQQHSRDSQHNSALLS